MTDDLVAEAARRFVAAYQAVEGADRGGLLPALVDRDAALHDLVATVDGSCATCSPGTCSFDELDLDLVDVVDPAGRL